MLDHIFFDVETTSLLVADGEIIELAAIRTDWKGNVQSTFQTKIKPKLRVEQTAAEVNGYTKEKWANAISFQDAISGLKESVLNGNKYVVVAYNADFDSGFLLKSCERFAVCNPFPGRAWIDPYQLAWILVYGKAIDSRKLTSLANYYGVDIKEAHTAMGDAEILMHVYFRMMQRFDIGQKVEGWGRKVAGEVMQGLFSVIQKVGQKQE